MLHGSSPPAACVTRGRVYLPAPPSQLGPHPRPWSFLQHCLYACSASRFISTIFLICHVQMSQQLRRWLFGSVFFFFFFVIPYTHRAAILGFQGLKWCFQLPFSLQRRAFVLTIVSSLSLLSSLPSSELQCFFYSYEHFATSSAILLLFSFSNERLLGLLSEFCPASVLHSCDMGELRHF